MSSDFPVCNLWGVQCRELGSVDVGACDLVDELSYAASVQVSVKNEVIHGSVGAIPIQVNPPVSKGSRVVVITNACVQGLCSRENMIGNFHCGLKPCRVGHFLFSGECTLPQGDVVRIWDGLCDGFPIVDEGFDSSYECANYLSITEGNFRGEMSKLLLKEVSEGKVS